MEYAKSFMDYIRNGCAVVKAIDWLAFFTGIGAGIGFFFDTIIPAIAALFSVIWLGIQIFVFIEKRIKSRKR